MLSNIIVTLSLAIKLFFYAIFSLVLFILTLVVGVKLLFEPVKGVCVCSRRLDGRTALVTGGNSGIGLETARGLARRGARVLIASRNTQRSQRAVADIVRTTGNANVEHRYLDLAKFSSVRQFAEDFNRTEPRLDILVNNAGCVGSKRCLSEDGIDLVTQINYFGPFLLTNLLLRKLEASKPSRIVIVSSLGHRFCTFDPKDIACKQSYKMHDVFIYARSKLLQLFWMKALAKRLPLGATVNALHPGVVKTDLYNWLPEFWRSVIRAIIGTLFKTEAEGAQTSLHLCLAPELESASGGYYADCRPRRPRHIVNDERLVENIWHESLILTQSK